MKEQLVSAEILSCGIVEDVYLLQPENSSDLSVRIAVTHLSRRDQPSDPATPAIILLHGQFSDRTVWFDYEYNGFARHMVEQGYEVWMPEMRGHGMSPENDRFRQNSLLDYVDYDFPAIQKYLHTRLEGKAVWVATGLTGLALAASLALGKIDASLIEGTVLAGLDDPRGAWRKSQLWQWRSRRRGVVSLTDDSGQQVEPYGIVHNRVSALGKNSGKAQYARALMQGLQDLTVPLLLLTGSTQATQGKQSAIVNRLGYRIYQGWGHPEKSYLSYPCTDGENGLFRKGPDESAWEDTADWLAKLANVSQLPFEESA